MKAAGCDGLTVEHLKFCHPVFSVRLLFVNSFIYLDYAVMFLTVLVKGLSLQFLKRI